MMTLLGIIFLICCIWITFKVLPVVIGITFTVFITLLEIIGFILLLPVIGVAFFAVDAVVLGLIIVIVKSLFN